MQLLFFVFSTLLSVSAFASNMFELPAPMKAGVYQYKGRYVAGTMAHQETVDRKFHEQKYQQLLKDGYGCIFKQNMIYLCKKFIPVVASDELTAKVNKKYDSFSITVHEGASTPALVEEGEYFTTWKVDSPVDFKDMKFNDYLLVRKPNFFGAWFKRSIYDYSVEIVSDHELRQTDEFWIKQSATGNFIYYINVFFER